MCVLFISLLIFALKNFILFIKPYKGMNMKYLLPQRQGMYYKLFPISKESNWYDATSGFFLALT